MEVASVSSQVPALLNTGVDRAERRGVEATPPANSARQAEEAQPSESTRVSLSSEGRSLLAAEQQQPPPQVQPQPAPQQASTPGPVSGPSQASTTSTTVSAAAAPPPANTNTQASAQGSNEVAGTQGNQNEVQSSQNNTATRANQQQA
ncbi:MAG: hypothetical protein ACRDD3_02115, partial [Azovibrio sp.]